MVLLARLLRMLLGVHVMEALLARTPLGSGLGDTLISVGITIPMPASWRGRGDTKNASYTQLASQ